MSPHTPTTASLLGVLLGALVATPAASEPRDLQALVDATPTGAELRLEPGTYRGGVVLDRPIRIDGGGRATVDGGGEGTVIALETDGAEIRGLRLVGSGASHDHLDAGVRIRGDGNIVEDNTIEDCLFGVELQQSNRNTIRNNIIRSKDADLGMRGDGVRLWYSRDNEIVGNEIADVRDVVVWYSGGNLIADNSVRRSRYALHFMYSERNTVEGNHYSENMVGIFLMYSDGVVIRNNRIDRSIGPTGMGIGFKESSSVILEGNSIVYCAKGIYIDISPYEPDTENLFLRNRLAFNGVGVVFHSDWHGNVFRDNDFVANFSQVIVRGGGSANRQTWEGNRWDDYRGFDRDDDGVGDTPYEVYAYADRFWVDFPAAEFFRGSPVFEVIDFLDRLAPFSDPTLILRDSSPRFSRAAGG